MKAPVVLLTAVSIGVTLLFLQGGSWFGPIGAAINLLTPVAAAYLCMRYGLQAGVVLVAVVSLLLLQLAPLYTLTAYLGLFGVGSLLLPFFLLRRHPWDRALFFSVAGTTIVTAAIAVTALLADGGRFDLLVTQVLRNEVDQALEIYRQAGFSESQLVQLQDAVNSLAAFIQQSFYGLFVATVLIIQSVCLFLLQRLKKNYYQIAGGPFTSWRLPAGLIWPLILAGFALLAPIESLGLLGRNLLAVLLPLYFLQGLAVVSNFLQRKAYPSAIKGLIYAFLFIFNPLPLIITGVGVFDLWIDFRRPRKKID